jgi:hypothetical protein
LELAPSAGRSFGGSEATFCGLPATELWNCPPLQKRRDCLSSVPAFSGPALHYGKAHNLGQFGSKLCKHCKSALLKPRRDGRFRREFGDRKRAEGTNFFTYPYSSGSRCRSFFYSPRRNHVGSPRVGFVGRTPQPPDTPNPKSVPEPRMRIMPGLCVLTRCWRHRE